jgi:hypothetical protein
VAYGIVLVATGGMLSGMGEGSSAAWSIFGSPFTVVPVFMVPPLATWLVCGLLIANDYVRIARWLVLLHYLFAPVAVYVWLRTLGDWARERHLLELTCYDDYAGCGTLLVPYLVGQVGTWALLRRVSPPKLDEYAA